MKAYQEALDYFATVSTYNSPDIGASLAEIGLLLSEIRDAFSSIRSALREIGKLANVPIEPESMTSFLDKCCQEPGILLAGVPGAGLPCR